MRALVIEGSGKLNSRNKVVESLIRVGYRYLLNYDITSKTKGIWQDWLRKEGYLVETFESPGVLITKTQIDKYTAELVNSYSINEFDLIITQSLGAQLMVQSITKTNSRPHKAILLAPVADIIRINSSNYLVIQSPKDRLARLGNIYFRFKFTKNESALNIIEKNGGHHTFLPNSKDNGGQELGEIAKSYINQI